MTAFRADSGSERPGVSSGSTAQGADSAWASGTESAEDERRYTDLRKALTRAVRHICPPWLAADVDDLVQVAMLRVMALDRKSQGNREYTVRYLYRTAHSVLIDEIRRRRRAQEISIDDEEEGVGELPAVSADPERRSVATETGAGIRECLLRLLASRRGAVTLYLQGHSVPEASGLLGFGAKRTENLVFRGLADLRRCLERKGLAP